MKNSSSINNYLKFAGVGLASILFATSVYNTFFISFDLKSDEFSSSFFNESKIQKTVIAAKVKKSKSIVTKNPTLDVKKVNSKIQDSFDKDSVATIQEDLNLKLVEAFNAHKFKTILNEKQIEGQLTANNGVIENLDAVFPNGDEISVNLSEMRGNTFSFEKDGQMNSGIIYQSQPNVYVVTFSAGEYVGVRLKYSSSNSANIEENSSSSSAIGSKRAVANDDKIMIEDKDDQGVAFN